MFSGVSERQAEWAGVRQDLDPGLFVEEPLTYWFNFSLQRHGHQLSSMNWKLNVETNGESQYYSIFKVEVDDSEWHDYGALGLLIAKNFVRYLSMKHHFSDIEFCCEDL